MVITLGLGSVIKNTATLFFCSVMLSSWYGGLWPGVFAALLSVVALDYYFIPPLYAFGISLEEAPDMIVFVSTALFIGWLSGEQKRAKESLRRARNELDAKVRERTAELKRANEQLQSEIAEREVAEEGLIRAQAEIARIARIMTMGELAASIAHLISVTLRKNFRNIDAARSKIVLLDGGARVLIVELLAVQVALGLLVAGFGAGQRAGADRIEAGVVDEPFGRGGRVVVVGGVEDHYPFRPGAPGRRGLEAGRQRVERLDPDRLRRLGRIDSGGGGIPEVEYPEAAGGPAAGNAGTILASSFLRAPALLLRGADAARQRVHA